MRSWNELELTGRTRTHVQQSQQPRFAATPNTLRAFLALRDAAAKDGFDLAVFSSFRDFHTQKRIWIRKLTGERPLYDEHGQIRDRAQLTEQQIVRHIFDWSALPGPVDINGAPKSTYLTSALSLTAIVFNCSRQKLPPVVCFMPCTNGSTSISVTSAFSGHISITGAACSPSPGI